jgi:hypothetical protein
MNPVGMALDGKLIVSLCQLGKAIWGDFFGIIICCSQYESVTICHAYGIQINTHDFTCYRYAMPTAF